MLMLTTWCKTTIDALRAHRAQCTHGDCVCYWTCAECRLYVDRTYWEKYRD